MFGSVKLRFEMFCDKNIVEIITGYVTKNGIIH